MRTSLLYLALVGLPVLGVLAILRVGEGLTPPPAIGGEWAADTTGGTGAPVVLLRCADARSAPERHVLHGARLSQSGTTAAVALEDAAGTAWAEGTLTLRPDGATAEGILSLVGCDAPSVRATLALAPGPRPQALTLSVTPADCAGCPSESVRVVPSPRRGRDGAAGPSAPQGH